MLSKIIKVIFMLIMIGVIAYFGVCVYANVTGGSGDLNNLPDADKAQYLVHIVNTGNLLLTNSYEQIGLIYTLHGYWELIGEKWKYRRDDLQLDSNIFGEIKVRRR